MAERKARLRSAMAELDELKDKMSDDAYLMLCDAAKEGLRSADPRGGADRPPRGGRRGGPGGGRGRGHDEEEEEELDPAYPIVAGHAIVPEGVTEIGDNGFFECSSLNRSPSRRR